MRIALIGYGKMGKAIEEMALQKGHTISLRVGREGFSSEDLIQTDVAIEFSTPDAAVANIEKCALAKVPVVVGTTAWYPQFDSVCEIIRKNDSAMLTATNFSIGVNLFWKIVSDASALLNKHPEYNIEIREIHHLQKLDAPSGTAITTAERILQRIDRKNQWVHHEHEQKGSDEPLHLNIESVRTEGVPGTHEVIFKSAIDTIEINHIAHSRKGFALGALQAAEWLCGKTGIFNMDDILNAEL